MKLKLTVNILLTIIEVFLIGTAFAQSPCDVLQVLKNPNAIVVWSPDSSKYLVNVQDTAQVFQIYVGNKGDSVPVCISSAYTNGNCCGLFRSWNTRNKMQVQWHPSGKYIVCAVEKEYYQEVLYVPYYPLRLGWLQCGLWMDIWAVTPDGSHWYNLANTINGVTGPAFTHDGKSCAWAEAMDTGSIFINKFGVWRLHHDDFVDGAIPSFANDTDITPAGAIWIEPGNFSPDGKSLLISSDIGIANAEGQDQFILDVTTGNVTNLTNSPMIWDEHGMFSPDGNKILFMSSYPYRADTNSYHTTSIKTEFMLINKDGSGLQQLTHFCDTNYYKPSPGIAAVGIWTPNGSTIYATSLVYPDYNYWIINFRGDCGNDSLTAINQLSSSGQMLIYPNPAQNILNIVTASALHDASLTITNTLGQNLKNSTANGSRITIETTDLQSGIYFLQLQSGTQRISGTFIKQD